MLLAMSSCAGNFQKPAMYSKNNEQRVLKLPDDSLGCQIRQRFLPALGYVSVGWVQAFSGAATLDSGSPCYFCFVDQVSFI